MPANTVKIEEGRFANITKMKEIYFVGKSINDDTEDISVFIYFLTNVLFLFC